MAGDVVNLLSTANAGTTEYMARRKTPERSKLVRGSTAAFARKQRSADAGDDKSGEEAAADEKASEAKSEAVVDEKASQAKPDDKAEQASEDTSDPKELPAIVPPEPRTEPWPDATPQPMKPVEPSEPVRAARTTTVAMPALAADVGRPPDMPTTSAPPPLVLGAVEDPTHMPAPKEIPSGNPDDPAPPPGRVPPGDSRSLRRGREFALIYRVGSSVITRTGTVGTRGQWRVVEYPTSTFASNSYAKECSRFVSDGFSDYRD